MGVWGEMLYLVSTKTLKTKALELRDEIAIKSKRKLEKELKEILEEIEYQEGRLQYANRPYSFPSARLPVPNMKKIEHNLNCDCGCWLKIFI
ncbi:hypothetical protein [Paenibacillus donghaensis]|uniref:Uncharacterized protein n=1 Tax=Paenibacillus donghaensis TaxID=414771 RepID=A0A2Z2KN67_9BACL|nr:hypothetical protein [Paenibacillus donghaensis]ASA22622.1 hypothetical protein B9T62_18620 [Paenibacillus donghaensis]